MDNLEKLVAEWRKTMMTTPNVGREAGDHVVMNDNPILRPVENAEGWTRGGFDVSGRESNPILMDEIPLHITAVLF